MRVVRRVAVVFVAVLLVLGGTASLGPVAQAGSSAGPSCAGAVQQAQPAASTDTPVVFVHGWTGKTSDFKQSLGPYVERTVGSSVRMYYFDYSAWSTYWPTDRHIAPCLAAFIHKITDPNKRPAVVVAHSMGGLAIRFAGSPTYAANPITKNQVAAVITLDTPALGSPWGSTLAAGGWGTFQQTQINKLREVGGLPFNVGGNASDCLAVHASMPRGCAIAPYLPPGIAITTVAGEATVKRHLFGIELYKVNTFSDGIVPTRSSRDYLKSGPPGTSPTSPGKVYSRQVSCDIGTDILHGDQALTGAVLAGLADNNALNELLEGNAITTSFPILAWVILGGGAACNHTTITKNPQAMQIVADYIKQHRTASAAQTRVMKVWPSAANGWTMRPRSDDPCYDSYSNRSDVGSSGYGTNPEDFTCGSVADSLLACKAKASKVTCLVNYETRDSVTFTSPYPEQGKVWIEEVVPSPLQVRLVNGTVCNVVLHDHANHYQDRRGFLYCDGDHGGALLLNASGDYFDKSSSTWTAEHAIGMDAPTRVPVSEVIYAD